MSLLTKRVSILYLVLTIGVTGCRSLAETPPPTISAGPVETTTPTLPPPVTVIATALPAPTHTSSPTATSELSPQPTEAIATPSETLPPSSEIDLTALPLPLQEVQLNEPFTLTTTAIAQLAGGDLTLHFVDVLEDSRCPRQVVCVWSGSVRILLAVQKAGQVPLHFEMSMDGSSRPAHLTYAGYDLELTAVNPYPVESTQKIAVEDYEATFVLTK